MKKILFCWEIGGGLGHLYRLLPIGTALRSAGQQVVFVVPERSNTGPALQAHGFEVVPAPFRPPIEERRLSLNYAQNLLKNGFTCRSWLKQHLVAWNEIMAAYQPCAVLAEHAPGALLAARHLGLPRMALGTGFTLPPLSSPMPGIQPWFHIPEASLLQMESVFLSQVNPVLKEIGLAELDTVASIFTGAETMLCTLPELDHYAVSRPGTTYMGPQLFSPPTLLPVQLPQEEPVIFIYANATNLFLPSLFQALRRRRLPALAFIPGLNPAQRLAWESPQIIFADRPVNLNSIASRCRFMVSQGSHNAGTLMLLQGVPLLLCPQQVEQAMWSFRLDKRRLGIMLNPFNPLAPVEEKLTAFLDDNQLVASVQSFARRHAALDGGQPARHIIEWIDQIN